jgi:hypothetical protein
MQKAKMVRIAILAAFTGFGRVLAGVALGASPAGVCNFEILVAPSCGIAA